MKTFYLSNGLLFDNKDLAIITTNDCQLVELTLPVDTKCINGTVHVDATGYGDDIETILETTYNDTFEWLDRTDIVDYIPLIEYDREQDGWFEDQLDVDVFRETDKPFYVATNVRMSVDCNFKFEDLSMELQKKILTSLESRIND